MRPWRLLIEFGEKQEDPPVELPERAPTPAAVEVNKDRPWGILKEARANMLRAHSRGDAAEAAKITMWIGGGLAVLAEAIGEDAQGLLSRLSEEVPSSGSTPVSTETTVQSEASRANFYPVERKRPLPPPGAPRPIKPEDLTPEERAELGIVLPGEEPAPAPKPKAPAKKATARKRTPKKATS